MALFGLMSIGGDLGVMEMPLGIEVIDDAIANCPQIIEYLDTLTWAQSPVGIPGQTSEIRTSSSVFLPLLSFKNPEVIHELARKVWQYIGLYATTYGITIDEIETISFNKYEPGQSFDPHTDYFSGSNRVVSAVVFLNTVNVGGQIHFTHLDYSVSALEGRIVVFPSNFLFHHAGIAPASATKYSAAFWARG
jgi:prolyl 4-hydroxylase